jgi:ankyrin repeat protein
MCIRIRSHLSHSNDVGNAEALAELIGANSDVTIADMDGNTPLHVSAASGSVACVTLCLNRLHVSSRAIINVRNNRKDSPLIIAARLGHAEMVRILLDAGAVPWAAGQNGWTALHWAAAVGCIPVARLLLAASHVVDAQNKKVR